MSDDLIKRLQAEVSQLQRKYDLLAHAVNDDGDHCDDECNSYAHSEACDEKGTQLTMRQQERIERLQATVEHLQDTCKETHDSMIAMMNEALDLRAALGRAKKLEAALRELSDWFQAYPEDIFTPLQGDPLKKTGDYDTKEKRNLITRASASMARHMIERIPRKITKALAGEKDDG